MWRRNRQPLNCEDDIHVTLPLCYSVCRVYSPTDVHPLSNIPSQSQNNGPSTTNWNYTISYSTSPSRLFEAIQSLQYLPSTNQTLKPTPIHAKHDLCLILLDFLTNAMYERQSSRSTTPLLFNSKLSSFYISQHFHSLQNESDLWERSTCVLSFYLSRKRRACSWWRRGKTDWNECLSATRHFLLHLTLFGFFQPTTFSLANKQSKSIISTPSAIHSRR